MISTYLILNQNVCVSDWDVSYISDYLECFRTKTKVLHDNDVRLKIERDSDAGTYYGIRYFNNNDISQIRHLFFSEWEKSWVLYTRDDNYDELIMEGSKDLSSEAFMELFMAGFYSYMSLQQTLLMHASVVDYEGRGIVFTAPSGTGKTTQAELWAKHRNATILNGDKVFLKQEEDGIHAWGSPWKGSSPYAENRSVPLKAIVILRQAEENSVRKLTGMEVMELVFPHVFFPKWDERCEQAVLEFLDLVLQETAVYLLQCTPDETAVALLENTIFKE